VIRRVFGLSMLVGDNIISSKKIKSTEFNWTAASAHALLKKKKVVNDECNGNQCLQRFYKGF
jgi:hypothetical protein